VEVSKAFEELITKLVPAEIDAAGTERTPIVPPGVLWVTKILDAAVTAVVATVIVPAVIAAVVPIASDAAVVAWIRILLPVLARFRLPFVAVILPRVAVRVVEAVKLPVTAVFPVALPRLTAPVPPVPMEVTAAPLVLIFVVPVIAAPPAVTVNPPATAVRPPAVAVRPVEAVRDPVTAVLPVAFPMSTAPVPPVPMTVVAAPVTLMWAVPTWVKAARVVEPSTVRLPVTVKLPGAVAGLAREMSTVEPEPVVVIEPPPPPEILMFPALGVTTVESSVVRVSKLPADALVTVQTAVTVPPMEDNEVRT
jgi:hypothetical protein